MINALSANFITSSPNLNSCDNFSVSEVAFLGRSNVGKSSFINALVDQKNLAKSSSTPGKTQLINFFEAKFGGEDDFRTTLIFVDLPGFGYAKVSKKTHEIWKTSLDEFLKKRENIRLFVHLIDSRQYDLDIDKNVDEYLKSFLRPDQKILNFYTKSDKLNQSDRSKVLKFDKDAKFVSTLKKTGIKEARELIVNGALGLC
ncbi:ribosome biogenesis GTP-binding protein YihA/YsxC [Campylobacter geochelonis]|uniref:Probable GTP-binding protein EngB n=1 Tax=Campylobacter geochelonis TaxID=1780362 RepID=A0A128EK09_9BACT|nr:ribosome biogenesis GTP-binding protein YihA/YsxC [Campylobacter geochelonis]QKF71674.1 ribosome biogenesis GTP-binding protein YsxC/EngB [Campylobacter geochelonis]CZE49249.1 ribosome biogenesis GTP-binding protein YsxC [Campylobacter geochelonis]CZE49260.1 ribosome biogenesis GTP-binding protein YsxC [Campylobacter geochelonis]CZE51292.1 ribosome biogenesis GTP-binding protein YsxC [Campylobacter geochelonis]